MISLQKGQRANLTKDRPNLKKIMVGLGWDACDSEDFDLDASAFLIAETGRVKTEEDVIFYNNRYHSTGAVEHTGDNRTGSGDGDDEIIHVDLTKIPAWCTQIVFTVTIDQAEARSQNFGMVDNAYVHLVDAETQEEILRYDLSESDNTALSTAMEFARIYKKDGEWKFKASGMGFSGGLAAMCRKFGIDAE